MKIGSLKCSPPPSAAVFSLTFYYIIVLYFLGGALQHCHYMWVPLYVVGVSLEPAIICECHYQCLFLVFLPSEIWGFSGVLVVKTVFFVNLAQLVLLWIDLLWVDEFQYF